MQNQTKKSYLTFHISKNREIEEILWIYGNRKYFQKNNYKIILPKFSKHLGTKLEKIDSNKNRIINLREIKLSPDLYKEFLKEFNYMFNVSDYYRTIKIIKKQWQKIESRFFPETEKLTNIKPLNHYRCYITQYGAGGSYGRQNEIYIRVNKNISSDTKISNFLIAHELFHLLIIKQNKYKKLSQIKKENMIDELMTKSFLRNRQIRGVFK